MVDSKQFGKGAIFLSYLTVLRSPETQFPAKLSAIRYIILPVFIKFFETFLKATMLNFQQWNLCNN